MKYIQKEKFTWTRKTTVNMGKIEATIELINGKDAEEARNNNLGEEEIRCIQICAQVDTGSMYLYINENIQQVLQLPVIRIKKVQLADGRPVSCDFVGPIELRFKNRVVDCAGAVVLPGSAEPLLGLLPLEEMDVIIDPNRNELIVNPDHPDYALNRI
jgi:predicted aspartyl protease